MLNNIFELEEPLVEILKTIFTDDMIFLDEDASDIKQEIFRGKIGNERRAIAVQYDGFEISDEAGKGRNQLIEIKYRVIVVAPVADKMFAGESMAQVIKALVGNVIVKGGTILKLVKDVREFNAAQYGDGMVAIPVLTSYKRTIKG